MSEQEELYKQEISCRTCKHENDCYNEVMFKCGDDDMKYWVQKKTECPHCKFIEKTFCGHPIDSNRNYWHMTKVFVYLHDGKDSCNYNKEKKG